MGTVAVEQSTSGQANSDTVSLAYGSNLVSGNLVIVFATQQANADPTTYVAGDCTQSAGTATLDTISIDEVVTSFSVNSAFMGNAIWSAVVTGAGSCTMQVSNGGTPQKHHIHIMEVSTTDSWDSSRVEDSDQATATSSDTAPNTPDITSANGAIFVGGLGVSYSGGSVTITDGSDYTRFGSQQSTGGPGSDIVSAGEYRIVTTGTTDGPDWTASANAGMSCTGVVYKDTGGAGGGLSIPVAYHHHTRTRKTI